MSNCLYPLPLKDFFPIQYHNDSDMLVLIDYIEKFVLNCISSIQSISHSQDVYRCPVEFLDLIGYYLNAGIIEIDTPHIKRLKILGAIQSHKYRGSWLNDIKPKIDLYTGYNASLYSKLDDDDSIELANVSSDPIYYGWSMEGANHEDFDFGTWEIANFQEYVLAGLMDINLHEEIHTPVLTNEQIQLLKELIEEDGIPAYFIIRLGYEDVDGVFIIYDGGIL